MTTSFRWVRWTTALATLGIAATVQAAGCISSGPDAEDLNNDDMAFAGDCNQSDQAGNLPAKARSGQVFNARLSYRQTNDAGQGITAACDLSTHTVTSEGMYYVPLHCSNRSQAASGYARVGARWGTSAGEESCTKDFCAAIYIQDAQGQLREAVRDIYLKDRFYCGQTDDRNDERLDIDACTYADVIGALKGTGASADDSNLSFDARGKLTGYAGKGYTLKYKMYECSAGPGGTGGGSDGGGGACTDIPPDNRYTCAQQAQWGQCGQSWMQGKCNASCGRCGTCDDVPPDNRYTCAQQAQWGQCGQSWMQGKCNASCGRCGG